MRYWDTVDGINPKQPPGMFQKLCNECDHLPTSTGEHRISEPSIVCWLVPWRVASFRSPKDGWLLWSCTLGKLHKKTVRCSVGWGLDGGKSKCFILRKSLTKLNICFSIKLITRLYNGLLFGTWTYPLCMISFCFSWLRFKIYYYLIS